MMRSSRRSRALVLLDGQGKRLLAGIEEREPHVGPRHGEALHRIDHRERFRTRRFQEFQPRRRGEEKVAHLDPRAALAGCKKAGRFGAGGRAAFDAHGVRLALARARGKMEPRHGADGRQRLAAKAERGDVGEVVVAVRGERRASKWRGVRPQGARFRRPCPRRCRRPRSGWRRRHRSRCRSGWRRHRARFRPVPSPRSPGARPPRRRRCG